MRILLVEDERELSNALACILKHSHYSVDAVYDGQEALDYIRCADYDAVILDIMLPKADGITVLKTIRAEGNNVPVIVLTAKSEVEDKVLGLDSGANDYLTKPFAAAELLARLRAITRAVTPTALNSVLKFNDLTLDRSTFELASEKGRLKLANKEFQMMEMFMSEPKKVFSVDLIMDKIWGCDSEAEYNVVWVYVSYLRKKLAAVGSSVQIKASRNLGYYLEAEE